MKADAMAQSEYNLLGRIRAMESAPSHEWQSRNLLHAYVACFSFAGLCDAIAVTLSDPAVVRLALRNRLLRLLRLDQNQEMAEKLTTLVEDTIVLSEDDKRLRQAADALHSSVFSHLPLPTQQLLLDRWADRGTAGTMVRWFKATRENAGLFDAETAVNYWNASRDSRAAKAIAYQAPPETLTRTLPSLIDFCDEGWIIAKAILRSRSEDAVLWEAIKKKLPATYLYVCAQTKKKVTPEIALELVRQCPAESFDTNRGLAIWAVGQMGLTSALDQIAQEAALLPPERLPQSW